MTGTTTTTRTPAASRSVVDAAQRERFAEDGYCVLSSALPAAYLDLLDAECARAIANVEQEMDRRGVAVIGGSRRDRQYTPGNCRAAQPRLREFLMSDFTRDICRALVGPEAYLVWEQFSVKLGIAGAAPSAGDFGRDGNPQSQGRFSWHQDSGYVPRDHDPYLTCWVALDDTTASNGALRVLPFGELGIRTRVTHLPEPDNGDLTGYFGPSAGKLVEVPRGSVVCFSSVLFHSSGTNETAAPRRAFLAQFAPSRTARDGGPLWTDAERL